MAGSEEEMINKRYYCFAKLVFIIVLYCELMFASTAQDLQPGGVLRDWEALQSSNGVLKLGFFGASFSRYSYLGISIGDGVYQGTGVIWVANRDRPLSDHSSVLNLGSNGSLMINSTSGPPIVVYSGQDAMTRNGNISLALLDTGNLVLRAAGGDVIWQSIDYPTDTWLPGMKLGWFDLKSGQPRQQSLISWVSPFIPAPSGPFTLGVDPNNTKQLVIWQRGVVYWSSGDWNGEYFTHLKRPAGIIFTHVSNENESYFTYKLGPQVGCGFLTLNSSGAFDTSFMERTSSGWFFDSHSCAMDRGEYYYWTGGCAESVVKPSNCSTGNEFVPTTNFKDLFVTSNSSITLGIDDCKKMCLKNCSCIAYASFALDGTGCMFSTGTRSDGYTSKGVAYVRQTKKEKPLLVIILVPVIIAILVSLALSFYYLRRRASRLKEKHNIKNRELLASELDALGELGDTSQPKSDKDNRFPFFSFSVIKSATGDFSLENKLGQGGFGPVYKGKLENGKDIAVKRLSRSSSQGIREFRNEVLLISKLQHRNLVRLLGCCIQGEERLLIYEYLPNKSLDSFIFNATKRALLDWNKRFSIIQGIAQGLLYLHKYSRLRIIHRDLKTSNILLDNELNPKISDFGTARIFGNDESRANTGTIVGTYGYMSPEYAMEGLFSEKSDVFSYGVMMLEIIGSRKNTSFYHGNRFVNLLGYTWSLWEEGKSLELIMDSGLLEEQMPQNEVVRCIHIALTCVQENATDRPNMSEVVSMLTQDTMTLPAPKQPAFFQNTNVNEERPNQDLMPQSVNKVTISEIQGR